MEQSVPICVVARVHSDFPSKFGIPRQSGLAEELRATVVFEPEYRHPDIVRGLDGFSHIWLLWQFSEALGKGWSPTVRPPRLGGNTRVGVFASRTPFRPNAIGLSSVRLERIKQHRTLGPVLHIAGADLMDGTPVYDIKPYLPYTDAHPAASGGFSVPFSETALEVDVPDTLLKPLSKAQRSGLLAVLAQDPRPAYHHDDSRVYTLEYAGFEVRFTVSGSRLTVSEIRPSK